MQMAYLRELLPLLDPGKVVLLEVYNEQGWEGWQQYLMWESEEDEIAWTERVIAEVRSILPEIPIGFSHAGHGMLGMDPVRWLDRIPSAMYYSYHFYPCGAGDGEFCDYGVIPNLISHYARPLRPVHCGESGLVLDNVPEPERTYALRDSLWSSLGSGAFGFQQWPLFRQVTTELAEYKSAARLLERHPVPAWHRKKARWALDASLASTVLEASRDYESKKANRPWTTLRRWDAYFRHWAAAYDLVRDPTGYERILDPFAEPPVDEIPTGRPVHVEGSYEGIPLVADEGTMVYLRNGEASLIADCWYRRKSPGRLVLTLPPDGEPVWAGLYDLDAVPGDPGSVRSEVVEPGEVIAEFDPTDHDFVLFLLPLPRGPGISIQ